MKEISHCLAVVMPILHIILSVHNSLRKNKKEREKGTSDGEGGGGVTTLATAQSLHKRFPHRNVSLNVAKLFRVLPVVKNQNWTERRHLASMSEEEKMAAEASVCSPF